MRLSRQIEKLPKICHHFFANTLQTSEGLHLELQPPYSFTTPGQSVTLIWPHYSMLLYVN